MSWTHDALWSKAKIYADRAFNEDRETCLFPFWASLAIEFLARAALARRHPALLADLSDGKNLLYAFGWSNAKFQPKAARMSVVLDRCTSLFPDFLEEYSKFCLAFANRRNEELHTGGLPFEKYETRLWLPDFFAACVPLLAAQGRSMADFVGPEEAAAADEMMKARRNEILGKVKSIVAAHQKVFSQKPAAERTALATESHAKAEVNRSLGGHMVDCPACSSKTSIFGEVISAAEPRLEDHQIVVRESVLPNELKCAACGLHLSGHAQLHAAGLGGQFTRKTTWDPLEYYGGEGEEYDNE